MQDSLTATQGLFQCFGTRVVSFLLQDGTEVVEVLILLLQQNVDQLIDLLHIIAAAFCDGSVLHVSEEPSCVDVEVR